MDAESIMNTTLERFGDLKPNINDDTGMKLLYSIADICSKVDPSGDVSKRERESERASKRERERERVSCTQKESEKERKSKRVSERERESIKHTYASL